MLIGKSGDKSISKYYRVNNNVPNINLLVIDADGQKLGVISKEEALKRAQEQELDLVEIAPQARPPVARILDFQKFRYEENKKEQAARKNAKGGELKEIWLTPRIAEHDLQTRLKRAGEFLEDGNKVLIRVKFKGREMGHMNLGHELLNKIYNQFGDKIIVERTARAEGRNITTIIARSKGGQKNHEENSSEQKQQTQN